MRRELLYGVAAVAILGASASQPVAAGEPFAMWTGFYVGGHLGAGWSDWGGTWDPSESPPVNFDDRLGTNGLIGGMQAGVNYQFPKPYKLPELPGLGGYVSFVIGAEVDVSAVGGMVEGTRVGNIQGSDPSQCHVDYTAQCGTEVNSLVSLRARLGVAFDPVPLLAYVTLGPAWADADAFVGSSDSGQTFDFGKTGIAWGFGAEWMARPNLVFGIEWLRYDMNDNEEITFEATDGDPELEFENVDVIRARMSYKFGAPAFAAAGATASQPAAADKPFPWTGLYAGAHLGGGWSDWGGTWDPSGDPVSFDSLGSNGLVGGMHVGVNYQSPLPVRLPESVGGFVSFVIGAEASVSAVGGMVEGTRVDNITGSDPTNCHPASTAQCGEEINWLMSLRGRLGVAFDPILAYGTLGLAFADAHAFVSSSSSGQTFEFNQTGIAWGLGVEWMAQPNLVVGVEWLRYDFNDEEQILFEAEDGDHIEFDNVDVVSGRVSYMF